MELNDILTELASLRYRCNGFPAFVLHCNDEWVWSCFYRNPSDFSNPRIEAKTPLEACKQMKEFVKGLTNGTTETNR